jgi:hypothetical protein
MARGGHGLPKVSPGPAMPYPSTPCGQPPLKQPHSRFRGCPPCGQAACIHFLPLWTPHAVRLRREVASFVMTNFGCGPWPPATKGDKSDAQNEKPQKKETRIGEKNRNKNKWTLENNKWTLALRRMRNTNIRAPHINLARKGRKTKGNPMAEGQLISERILVLT